MISNKYIIGIDGGGSKTHALLIDHASNIIDEAYSGSANIKTEIQIAYDSINSVIQNLIIKNNLDPINIQINLGIAGYSVKTNRDKLLDLLIINYPNIKISSDSHIACLAAHNGSDGAIIICGTGVSAYYMQENITKQIGGWGFPHGDLGGGAWVGLELCRYTCKAIDHVINFSPLLNKIFLHFNSDANKFKTWLINAKPSDFANITKFMLELNYKDPIGEYILNKAITEIIDFTRAVTYKVPNLPIKITGGLAKIYHPILQKTFSNLEIMEQPPAYGACLLK